MKTFNFTVIVRGVDLDSDRFEDAFFEAGCDDAIIAIQRGALTLEFDREAETFDVALTSALQNVRSAGAKVVRVEPDTLVSMSEAGRRSGLSRSAMSNYARAERGQRFPAPVVRVLSESPLWDWVQVAEWLARQSDSKISDEMVTEARAIKRANQNISSLPVAVPSAVAAAAMYAPVHSDYFAGSVLAQFGPASVGDESELFAKEALHV